MNPPRITIESAQPAHLPVLHALDPDAPADRADALRRAISQSACRIALLDDRPAGLMLINEHWFGYRFVELIVVTPPLRCRGVATALLNDAITSASTPKVFTSTNESNLLMQALLARAGFVPSGILQNLDDGDPELVYVKVQSGKNSGP